MQAPRFVYAGLMVAVIGTAGHAQAESWSRFRGPNGTGHAKGPFTAPLTDADFAWKQPLPGIGHSSPVVWEDHVYVTSADQEQLQRYVFCLSAETGKELWRNTSNFIQHRKHRDNSFASSTPTADELGVYVVFTTPQDYTLLALSHDGKERWRKSLGRYDSTHGGGASPMLHGDLVILNHDQEGGVSDLRAYHRKSGEMVWSVEGKTTRKAAMSTPTVWKPAAGPEQLVVTTFGGGIQGVDPANGKRLWAAADVFFSRPIGSPQIAGDLVIGVCGEGTAQRALVAVKPDPLGAQPPAVVYTIEQLGPHVPCPLIAKDRLILLNDVGQLSCADVATGKVLWTQKVGAPFYGSPILVGDVVWAISKGGDLYGWRLGDSEAKEICKLPLGDKSHSTPAVADGRMFLRTMSAVICIKK